MRTVLIFADGACSGNPGPGGWGAIVYQDGQIKELGGSKKRTTNNEMELMAAAQALEAVDSGQQIKLYTDSRYVIRGITEWIWGWRKKGWVTQSGSPVLHQALWERLDQAARAGGKKVQWLHVPGHQGIEGNERADRIAVAFRDGEIPFLYSGTLDRYSVSLEVPDSVSKPSSQKKSSSKGKVHYLSLVDGVPAKHKTWKECEKRVSGRSGAKYKKVSTPTEEVSVFQTWGIEREKIPKEFT